MMHYRINQTLIYLALNCFPQYAQAQHNIEELMELDPAQLAEIPVSIASGTPKSLSHSAAVTSVITAEQISTMGATDLHEVLETVPGLHATKQPLTNDYSFSLRGIRNDTNSEVLLLMNGTRFSVPQQGTHMVGMVIPVQNIQRIEVIRGPGSALYGADAFAGVINIITKKANDLDGVRLGARGGNKDMQSSWGQYGGQWQGWDVAASLQYGIENHFLDANQVVSPTVQAILNRNPLFGNQVSVPSGSLQTRNERWNGHLNLQRKHWELGFWAFNETNTGLPANSSSALDNPSNLAGSNYLADIRYSSEDSLEEWELQAHGSLLHTDTTADIYVLPANSVVPIGVDGNLSITNPRGLVAFSQGAHYLAGRKNTVPSFEFTSIYKGFADHFIRMVAGFRYEELNTQEYRNFGAGIMDGSNFLIPPSLTTAGNLQEVSNTPLAFLTDHHRDILSLAVQDEWQLARDWHLTAGVRYDHYSDFGSTLNPRSALVWDINSELTAKILYGQAYRAPSFLEQYQQNSPQFLGTPSLRPETIETTELAFDYRPARNLRTTVNLFYYKIKDLIGGEFLTQNNILTETNTPGQHGYGSEFEWDWKFHPDWTLRGNYAWQYAQKEATLRRVSNIPEHHVYSALAWNFLPKWHIQTQINWLGHRPSSPGDTRILEDYETIDMTLTAKSLLGHLDLTASARNLLDSHGKEAGTNGYPNNISIPGQSFYFEASIHF